MLFLVCRDTAANLESYTWSHLIEILSDKSLPDKFWGSFSLSKTPATFKISSLPLSVFFCFLPTSYWDTRFETGARTWAARALDEHTDISLSVVTSQADYQIQLIFPSNTGMAKLANSGKLNILQVHEHS